jgi:hypothetical protein
MSRILEIPDPVFTALRQAAEACGMTPVGWIAAHLPQPAAPEPAEHAAPGARTLADLFAGRVGRIEGGGHVLPEETAERFTDYLEAKRRAGRL